MYIFFHLVCLTPRARLFAVSLNRSLAGIRPSPPKDTSNIGDRQCTGQETRYLTLSSSADGVRRLLWRIYSPYQIYNLDESVFHTLLNHKKIRFMPYWRRVNIHASCVMGVDRILKKRDIQLYLHPRTAYAVIPCIYSP